MISRVLRRSFVFLLVMTFVLSSVLQIAYAEVSGGGSFDDDQIIYGPTIYNPRSAEYAVLVYSGTSYNAALVALGYNPYEAKFTDDVKAYLSNNTTGGSFYEFANLFSNQRPDDNFTLYGGSFQSAWFTALTLYPENNLFGAIYTEALANSAKQRVEDVLAGDVSGGSGDQPSGLPTEFTMHPIYYDSGVNVEHNSQFTYSASLAQATVDALSPYLADYPYFFAYTQVYRNTTSYNPGSRRANLVVGLSKEPYVFNGNSVTVNDENVTVWAQVDFTKDGFDYKKTNFSATSVQRSNSITITVSSGSGNVLFLYSGSGSGEPTVPPSNWPDNPTVVTPSPPELPDPRDPVIPNPPADPVPTDPPTYITQPTYNVSVFTADLQGILDAMDEHCIHLQNALYTDLNALYNKLASTITEDNQKTRTLISNRFTWLGNVISECLDALNDNLYDYFHWLGEQFDFQNSGGYNDSTVVAWLKKIYAKLGGGSPVNPKPVDPVSDPFDFGKWLSDLWNTFIADLIAIGAEGMAAIADDLQQLIHKFPFSIPWDIAAMLALLVAEPQTPVIQFPMFSYNGSVQVIQTTIDLSPYNNYVEPVRVMIKIGFAAVLAWRTKDMMELLTMARGGNNA